jgi:uncharacterized Zn-binding protein involved in type VI secretion
MPGPVVRMGDSNICGGVALVGNPTVRVNLLPIMVDFMPVTPHIDGKPPHTCAFTLSTTTSVRAGLVPVVTASDIDSCGHIRLFGSPTVRVWR